MKKQYRLLTTEDTIQEGDEFDNGGEWSVIFRMGTEQEDWMIGKKWNPYGDPPVRRSI